MPILIIKLIHNWLHTGYFSAGEYHSWMFVFDLMLLGVQFFAVCVFGLKNIGSQFGRICRIAEGYLTKQERDLNKEISKDDNQ